MKAYAIFFLAMKAALIIQFLLIVFKKQTKNSIIYILTEVVFKTTLFLFIEWFTFHNNFGIEFDDKLIISFGGSLLLYDAWFNDVPHLIEEVRAYYMKNKQDIPLWLGVPLGLVDQNIKTIKAYSAHDRLND